MSTQKTSTSSLIEATRSREKFSGHGDSLGAGGHKEEGETIGTFLSASGESAIINPHKDGFGRISIGAAWNNIEIETASFWERLFKKTVTKKGVDIDLGCLYELQDGKRGAVQAFGQMYGAFEDSPWIGLSGDERTGDADGEDEQIAINGQKWPEIKRVLVYVYIYDGVANWGELRPRIQVRVPGEDPFTVALSTHRSELSVCAIAEMEQIRGGVRLTNHTEYFPGHAEMDRAFGFGLHWEDGEKIQI